MYSSRNVAMYDKIICWPKNAYYCLYFDFNNSQSIIFFKNKNDMILWVQTKNKIGKSKSTYVTVIDLYMWDEALGPILVNDLAPHFDVFIKKDPSMQVALDNGICNSQLGWEKYDTGNGDVLMFPSEAEPYICWKHIDGPYLCCRDGTPHWLTLLERFCLWSKIYDIDYLDQKYGQYTKLRKIIS